MKKKTYKIHGITFSTQKSIEDKARSILYRDAAGTYLNNNDFDFMIEYFRYFHLDWDQKNGKSGIKRVKRNKDNYNKLCFWIERHDRSETDISFIISKISKKNFKSEFSYAMREAIKDQIRDFKKTEYLNKEFLICPIENIKVSIEKCHVDHHNPSFDELVKQFVLSKKIKLSKDLFPPSEDGIMVYTITDKYITQMFYDFHLEHANLRITSQKGNLTKKRFIGKR